MILGFKISLLAFILIKNKLINFKSFTKCNISPFSFFSDIIITFLVYMLGHIIANTFIFGNLMWCHLTYFKILLWYSAGAIPLLYLFRQKSELYLSKLSIFYYLLQIFQFHIKKCCQKLYVGFFIFFYVIKLNNFHWKLFFLPIKFI